MKPRQISAGSDDALLLRSFKEMLGSDYGRARILKHLPWIAENYFDSQLALRVLILRTMPYRDYLQTLHWRSVSAAAKDRAGGRCQMCNSAEKLEAHHRTYERRGCEADLDVTALCDRCHEKFHREPPREDVDSAPKLTEAEEIKWLTEMIASKRRQQGLPADYQTPPKSGTSSPA